MTSSVESPAAPPAPAPGAGPRTVLAVVAGLALSFVGAFWVGFGGAQLGHVLTTQRDVVSRTLAPSWTWVLLTAVTAAGLWLLSWPGARGPRPRAVAALGASWTVGWLAVLSFVGAQFEHTGPQARCTYSACWPYGWQELLVAAPLLVGCLVLLATVVLGRRGPRSLALVAPAATFVVLTLVQAALWERVVVPFLAGQPPFSS